jgi:hypothetical protein
MGIYSKYKHAKMLNDEMIKEIKALLGELGLFFKQV